MYSARIFVKPGCMKCRLTMNQLQQRFDLHKVVVDPLKDSKALEHLRTMGFMSFPVVQIMKDSKVVDQWSDFQANKIQQWKAKIA